MATVKNTIKTSEARKNRKSIWQVKDELLCSVCGTCLSMEEQREVLKKLKMDEANYLDYEIHGLMVQSLGTFNKLSVRINNLLNNKYRFEIERFGGLDEKGFRRIWQEKMKSGDICGLYWVAVTHPALSEQYVHELFCEVHMLSHLNGGMNRQEKTECKRLVEENKKLSEKLNVERKLRRRLAGELNLAEDTIRDLQTKIRKFETKTGDASCVAIKTEEKIKQLEDENRELKQKLSTARSDSEDYLEMVRNLNADKNALIRDLTHQKEINIQLCREIEDLITGLSCDRQNCIKSNEGFQKCERRVLLVGGLTKLRGYYRDIVEKMGWEFIYHDGYLSTGEKALEDLINKSDIVLCSTDVNSHNACLSVKKICKKLSKDYHILPSSSLSSISRVLVELSDA